MTLPHIEDTQVESLQILFDNCEYPAFIEYFISIFYSVNDTSKAKLMIALITTWEEAEILPFVRDEFVKREGLPY